MLQAIGENIHIVGWIFLSLLLLCVLSFVVVGIIVKRQVLSFDFILRSEQYLFAAVSSVFVFLTLSLPAALVSWVFIYLLMHFVFKKNRYLLGFVAKLDENKQLLCDEQKKFFSRLNNYFTSPHIFSWLKDFLQLRKEFLCALSLEKRNDRLQFLHRPLPFSVFAMGTVGLTVSLLTYESVIKEGTPLWMIFLENYAVLSCLLVAVYLFWKIGSLCSFDWGPFKNKKIFYIQFAILCAFACVVVGLISMNKV